MTNVEIINTKAMELMKAGVIGTTGKMMLAKFVDENGDEVEKEIPEPEAIHTYAMWKQLGYQVQKGEKAVARFAIWKYVTNKNEDDEEEPKMFMKNAAWFKASQVAPIKEVEDVSTN